MKKIFYNMTASLCFHSQICNRNCLTIETSLVTFAEEIFSQNSAMWFSPNGLRLAFARFNDSDVTEIRIPMYEPEPTSPYWKFSSVRYPKAGSRNPTVDLFMVDLSDLKDQKTTILLPPTIIRQRSVSRNYCCSVMILNFHIKRLCV